MAIELPAPIGAYVRAENSGDVDAMADCFESYATVRDENRYVEGLPAIRSWRAQMKQRHDHTLTPLDFVAQDGKATLKAEWKGKFPGSPVMAKFNFVITNDRIASLQIHNMALLDRDNTGNSTRV